MSEIVKSYKGFNADMTCKNGFLYEEGKEYETDKAEACECGFHACEYPLDVFRYYAPATSIFHEVEQSGEISRKTDGTKVASTKIKIGASISIAGMVKAAIEYITKRTKNEAAADQPCGASSATGDCGASSATGYCGASSATGYCGASSATGSYGASSATGNYGASSATGRCGVSSATGYCGASSAGSPEAVAVAWGYKSKAKGVLGAHLVFADWEEGDDYDCWTLKGAKMVQVDGDKIKPDTWYRIEKGEIIEEKKWWD